MNDKPLINRVANSSLININLEDFFPKAEIVEFDLKDYLFRELLLKEKDFRAAMKEHDWTQYQDKILTVFCSTDAIVPVWAYQLVAIYATPFAEKVTHGNKETCILLHYQDTIGALDRAQYQDQRIIVKGCGKLPVPPAAYTMLAHRLQPVAKSIMYGEACSAVPLYKKKK
ncbi:MAG: DUF2480 family protein [Aureispira sp.]|nr:DUF2480 family protein [Aureispira sp.]